MDFWTGLYIAPKENLTTKIRLYTGLGGARASVAHYNAGGSNPGSSLGRERRIEERPRGPDIVHPKAGTDISCEFEGC